MAHESLTESDVRSALAEVMYPGLNRDIVSFGLLRSVAVRNGRVHVSLVLSSGREEVPELLRAAIRERLAAVGAVRTEVQILAPERVPGRANPWAGRGRLPGVSRIVAVGSGKGGVGKSTVAVNLALALLAEGLRVGVLDADIYGPSIPIILGLEDGANRGRLNGDRLIDPLESHGLAVVSFGFFLGPKSPAVWRGPMVSKAVRQFSRGVAWPELDVLVVDLPPGTGDVPLSLAQTVVLDGGIVVTTPQRLAVQEAHKAVRMFRKLDTPVLGVVENMSFAECSCGRRSYPFGRNGGARLAGEAEVPLLVTLPFEAPVMEGGDSGHPLAGESRGAVAVGFRELAGKVLAALGFHEASVAGPHQTG